MPTFGVINGGYAPKKLTRKEARAVREQLFMRYPGVNGTHCCWYCGHQMSSGLTLEHITPLSRCGDSGIENIALVCTHCNRMKHNMTLEEFRAHVARMFSVDPRALMFFFERNTPHGDETCWCRPRVETVDGKRVVTHKIQYF